ncbi:hypothetical protein QMP25_24495 [Enterocloster clostridioformis]
MDSTVYPKTGNTLKGDVKHDSMRQRFIGSTERQRDKKAAGRGRLCCNVDGIKV